MRALIRAGSWHTEIDWWTVGLFVGLILGAERAELARLGCGMTESSPGQAVIASAGSKMWKSAPQAGSIGSRSAGPETEANGQGRWPLRGWPASTTQARASMKTRVIGASDIYEFGNARRQSRGRECPGSVLVRCQPGPDAQSGLGSRSNSLLRGVLISDGGRRSSRSGAAQSNHTNALAQPGPVLCPIDFALANFHHCSPTSPVASSARLIPRSHHRGRFHFLGDRPFLRLEAPSPCCTRTNNQHRPQTPSARLELGLRMPRSQRFSK
jgi:hypothetical protein